MHHPARRRAASYVAGVCLVAGLTGCQSSTHLVKNAAPEPSPSTSTAWAPPPPPEGTTTLINTGDYRFHTPSGNVSCHVVDLPSAIGARCDVAHYSYPPPTDPGVGCPHLNALVVGADGPSTFTCASEAPAPAANTLIYWDSVQVGRFTCKSKDTGVNCENTQTNHGFELGAAAFRRY